MIEIKDIQGNQLLSVPITQSCQKVEELMTADYVQLSWNSDLSDVIPVGSYIDINGEKYRLLEPYSPTQKDELEFTYTPKFESRVRAWGKMPFFFYSGISKEPDWTLTSNPADFMRCVCDSIRNESGESWTYSIDASLSASASLSFSSLDILSGLNQIASAFETEWFADKGTNTIYLGRFSHGEEVVLEVGKNISIPSVQSTKEGFYTRFYAFGSTRNITQDYNGANTNNLVNKRLTLDPIKYPNGYKDIRGGLREGEIFSKVLIFDNVYPSAKLSISDVRSRLMFRLDESGNKIQLGTDNEGNPIYDQYSIWYFRIEGFEFDFNNVIEGLTPSISFQSGALNGREFEVIYYDKAKKITTSDGIVFEVQAGDYEICFIEENNLIIPSMTGLVPSDGDDVVLFNIEMPSKYIQSAYDELEVELDKEIAKLTSDLNNYSFKSNPVAFSENNPQLSIGRAVRYVNGDYSYSTRVIKLTAQLDFPFEQSITIGNEKVKGNTQQLKEEVASANKDLNLLTVFNDMTQTIQQSYNRTQQMMLDGFAAIKNIWQLKTDANGNTYAFSAFDVVTQRGVTMYAEGEVNIPSIIDSLPIASTTAKGIASFDGTYFAVDSNGKVTLLAANVGLNEEELAAYLTEKKYATQSWVYSLGYASSSDLNALQTKVNDFLEGSDTDTIINKWKELESFLSGLSESDNLATILGTKADKATTLAGYGITDAYTKTKVDELLGNYVTLATKQIITGEKNFTGGLKVNGSPIVYDATNKYWKLEGDLLVTGGVTMYASDSAFTPSVIMDGVVVDNVTILKDTETGALMINPELVLGGGGGEVSTVAWGNVLGKPSWITDTKPSYSYSEISGTPTLLSSFNNDVGFITSSVYSEKLGEALIVVRANNNASVIQFSNQESGRLGFIGVAGVGENYGQPLFLNKDSEPFVIWHAGNLTKLSQLTDDVVSGKYLPLSGGTITGKLHVIDDSRLSDIYLRGSFINLNRNGYTGDIFNPSKTALEIEATIDLSVIRTYNVEKQATIVLHKNGNIGIGDYAPVYKLEVAGTFRAANAATFGSTITTGGSIYMPNGYLLYSKYSSGNTAPILEFNSHNLLLLGYDSAGGGSDTWICGKTLTLKYSTSPYSKIGIHITESGYVGVNKDNPVTQFDISGWAAATGYQFTYNGTGTYNKATITCNSTYGLEFEAANKTDSESGTHMPIFFGWRGGILGMRLENGGNLLVAGGITMYSDIRKKTKLQDVELTLQQIAEAPLIEHYYNSDSNKTTHVGSIAQYWASMNDWFCKLDNEGYYTMEVQNAALASAISIARELVKYESKTDRKIRLLKERVKELEKKLRNLNQHKDGKRSS